MARYESRLDRRAECDAAGLSLGDDGNVARLCRHGADFELPDVRVLVVEG
jgi:hypothetical protein